MVQFTNFFAGCNLHVLRKIIICKNLYNINQIKQEKPTKPTRKTHIKKKTINSGQHNRCNLAFLAKFQCMSLILQFSFVWSTFLACKTLPTSL